MADFNRAARQHARQRSELDACGIGFVAHASGGTSREIVDLALTGLACVGFPGTLGFISSELLVDSAVEASPYVGVAVVETPRGLPLATAFASVNAPERRNSLPARSITCG